jgi:aflatoxin B1 aldehyde reductase
MAVKLIFGGYTLNDTFMSDAEVQDAFALLKKEGIDEIDTARIYPGNEKRLGESPGHEDFKIATKLGGGFRPGTLTKENIVRDAEDSFATVRVPQFDILYIHAPDPSVSIEEALESINEVYKKGIFRRFGLSNFTAEQVQEVYDIAQRKGYPLPTVYQGNYNAIARKLETLVFPKLRELKIAFYAYSPIAGGFLAKSLEQIDAGAGRFGDQVLKELYGRLYNRPSLREALSDWGHIAEKEGISRAELAYRWVAHHSLLKAELGDGVLFGARTLVQLEQTIRALKRGPLSDEAVKGLEEIWKKVEADAPIDNYAF